MDHRPTTSQAISLTKMVAKACFVLACQWFLIHNLIINSEKLWHFIKHSVVVTEASAVDVFPTGVTTTAASPTSSCINPNLFAGRYRDPNHVNCQRLIQVAGHVAALSGTDGNPACPQNGSGIVWTLEGKIHCHAILVDFSPKGGPANLRGVYNATAPGGAGIQWPDGNKWTKI